MDEEKTRRLFAAHSSARRAPDTRFEYIHSENMSLVTLLRGRDNPIPAGEHAHGEYEFLIPHTPIPFLTNAGKIYFGEVGFVYPVFSGRTHGVRYEMTDVSHTDIVFDKAYFERILRDMGRSSVEFNSAIRFTDELCAYVSAYKRALAERGGDMHKPELLSELICRELIERATDQKADQRRTSQGYQQGMRAAAEFLNENCGSRISIAEMARMFGLSANYFCAEFKKVFGYPPQAYRMRLRLSRAKFLLENTDDPIADIADRCGWNDETTFSTKFRGSVGIPPSQYRRSRRSGAG